MSEAYKGMTIPEYSDAADGPGGFKSLIDSGPIPRFSNGADRDVAIPSPVAGQLCYANNEVELYNGSSWISLIDGAVPGTHQHVGTDILATVPASSLPSSSTSARGIVQLTNSATSTSTTTAATANAAKIAYDKGNHSHPYLSLSAGGTVTGPVTFTAETSFNQRIVANLGMKINGYKSDVFALQVRGVMITDTLSNVGNQTGIAGDVIFVYNAGSGSGVYARSAYAGGYNGSYWHKVAAL